MTREEFEVAITEVTKKTTRGRSRRNKEWRRRKKNFKDTRLYNLLLNVGYAYRTKWASEYWEDCGLFERRISYVKSLRGTGFYIKSCDSDRRRFFKRLSARNFRRNFKLREISDGNMSRRIALDMDWTLI